MGSFPHELPGYRHVSDDATRELFESALGRRRSTTSRACAFPTCSMPRSKARSRASTSRARTSCSPTPTRIMWSAGLAGDGMRRRAGSLPQRDGELRPCLPARLHLPRKGRHLHQCRAAHPARAQGDGAARTAMGDWEITLVLAKAMGYPDALRASRPRSWTRSRELTPTFAGVSYAKLDEAGLGAMAVQRRGAGRHADHAYRRLRARQGQFHHHRICADRREAPDRASRCCSPPDASSASTMSARRRGAPTMSPGTRRTCSRSIRMMPNSAASATATG